MDPHFLISVVQLDIGVRLGNRERSNLVLGHSAGGDSGNTSARKLNLNVGDIFAFAHRRTARRRKGYDIVFYQPKDDIQIVYHQIEHHAIIPRSFNKRSQTTAFDERGLFNDFRELLNRTVEPLDVADMKNLVIFRGDAELRLRVIRWTEGRP